MFNLLIQPHFMRVVINSFRGRHTHVRISPSWTKAISRNQVHTGVVWFNRNKTILTKTVFTIQLCTKSPKPFLRGYVHSTKVHTTGIFSIKLNTMSIHMYVVATIIYIKFFLSL